jgi:opine dehydrogenase
MLAHCLALDAIVSKFRIRPLSPSASAVWRMPVALESSQKLDGWRGGRNYARVICSCAMGAKQDMEIAVLGGGHGCYAAAADLSEQGHRVRLWRRDTEALAPVRDAGRITLRDHRGDRDIAIACITGDIAEAMDGAALLLCPLPAPTQADVAKAMALHLAPGQVVFMPPGTFGSYVMARAVADAGGTTEAHFAEAGTLPWLARKSGATGVSISGRTTRLPTGVLPAAQSERAFETLEKAFPAIERLVDGLDGALMNAGPIIHPPLILMNAGPIEHFDNWDIHNEGTQPAIRRVTDALDNERIAVREALGYAAPHFPLRNHYDDAAEEWMYGNAAHERLTDSGDWRETLDLEQHRYMREDVAHGLAFLVSVADWAGVPAPVATGLLSIASAVAKEDFRASGRTLENLGLARLSRAEMTSLMATGPSSQ